MKIASEKLQRVKNKLKAMQDDRLPFWTHWRDLADYYLPRRYVRLLSKTEAQDRADPKGRNRNILDSTGVTAARTLANGMMNGITSPARPWFKLRLAGFGDDLSHEARVWLDEVTRRILLIMAESNFYKSLAVLYHDLSVFSTAGLLIYESQSKVIHCYNPPLGEFSIAQDYEYRVNHSAREFSMKVHQIVEKWGKENCSDRIQSAFQTGGARLMEDIDIVCMIEPNKEQDRDDIPASFEFRETYWEASETERVLFRGGYNEFPGVFPRWDTTGNDAYGTGPSMDALPDVIQLQHETKKKAQGLDKWLSPPMLIDISLQHRPIALLPNGLTFANMRNTQGRMAEPLYTVNPPTADLTSDIREVQGRVRETFHNELFTMISQLDTVRSATEIDARREEKLVQLGPVLERFENECLDPAISRIYAIMLRRGLIPEAPVEIGDANLQIQYTSILSAAQSAVGTASTERWLQLGGNIVGIWPEVREVPDIIEVYRDYGRDIGVPAKNIRSTDQIAAIVAEKNQQQQAAAQQEQASQLAKTAQTLSQTDVGGGRNALQQSIQ